MKLIWTIVVVGSLATAGWYLAGGRLNSARAASIAPEALFSTRKGELEISVTENGYLKAKNSVEIRPEFQREATITWLIEEGKSVAKDEVLAEFDRTELENQIDDIEKQLLQSQNELASAKADLEIQRRDSEAAVQSAEFNLKVTRLKLERHDKGDSPNELRKLNLSVEKAESEYARAKERYTQVPELEKEGFMTKIQAEQERIRLKESEINLESVKRELELYTIYSEPMEREQLEVNVRDQERQLMNATEKGEINVRERETRVSRSESQLKQTEQRLDKLKKELDKMTIRAPNAGVIHYGDPRRPWERDEVKVGNRFYRGNTLFTLPDLREMQVLVQVHEADIDMVKLDQRVVVTLESARDRSFGGKVTRINSVADSNWADENNKKFGCEITMDPIDIELRAGISAKVEIQVEKLTDVLYVPIHAVVTESGQSVCFVPSGQTYERRVVTIGKNNAHYVVVGSGLAESEQVLLYDPREGDASEAGRKEPDAPDGAGMPAPQAP
ncbi:MAG: efflux RND transporter periplasmic adaptor subunit [Planctomycetes bacterium]|nr:efflux RND transporter periplasmic adaptor subunit [Planctomycetota bacterium]